MKIGSLLERKGGSVVTIQHHEPVSRAARLLMARKIGALPVTDLDGRPLGLVSERDMVRMVDEGSGEKLSTLPVSQVMRRPAPTCSEAATVREVMARMTRERLRHLVVVADEEIRGVISVGDLVKHRLEELETETGVLRDYVAAQRARR